MRKRSPYILPILRLATSISALCIIILLACTPDHTTVPRTEELPPVKIDTRVDRTHMRIGDLLQYNVTINAASNVIVQMPDTRDAFGGFTLYRQEDIPPQHLNNRVIYTRTYTLETYITGNYDIPGPHITYRIDGIAHSLTGATISVSVRSVVTNDTAFTGIRPLKGPVEIAQETISEWRYMLIAILAAFLAAACVLIALRRRKRIIKSPPPIPAHERAYTSLHALAEEHLPEKGYMKEYFYRLSHILRLYCEDRFGLHAPERTTEEFLQELHTTSILAERYRDIIAQFLTHSDLVKFANRSATQDDADNAYAIVHSFVTETREHGKHTAIQEHTTTEGN